jgi:protein SCO1/2
MSKKGWFYTAFFIALALVFYGALTLLVPGYNERTVPPISFVRPFAFHTQDGKIFTQKDVAGKVYVATYFFTTCKGICPKMNGNLRKVYDALKGEKDFLILSHTCDPETDSVPQIKKYADSMQVNTNQWVFLTGRKDSLYHTARLSYTIDDPANNLKSIDDDFMHTQFWALVDKDGYVRKIYDGLKTNEVNELIAAAKKMLAKK